MALQFQLDSFDIQKMALLGPVVRECAEGLSTLSEAAQKLVRTLDESIRMPVSEEHGLALARIYITRRFEQLDEEQAEFARKLAGCELQRDTVCLTLAGSFGRRKEWCDPKQSCGHLAIPLLSARAVESLPMVWQLFQQLGVDVDSLIKHQLSEDTKLRQLGLDVFHIERAEGSEWVPAQDFVKAQAVQSCVAIGGVLPDGEVFTLLLFSKASINNKSAIALRPLALSIEIALLPYLGFNAEVESAAMLEAFRKLLTLKDFIVSMHVTELQEAKVQAEAQSSLRRELLRNVRHELMTPLHGVLGTLSLLDVSKDISDDNRQLVEVAHRSASGLMHVLENLVLYSDLITQRRALRKSAFDLKKLLDGLIDPVAAQSRSLTWQIKISEECPRRIVSDEIALGGVMRQFVENAIKFTIHGQVEVEASLVDEGRMLSLSVRDTGIGIAEEQRAYLFEPFRQVDGSTKRRFGGTGLGLAIVAELAKQLDAKVEVASKLDEGSCFRLELPLVRA